MKRPFLSRHADLKCKLLKAFKSAKTFGRAMAIANRVYRVNNALNERNKAGGLPVTHEHLPRPTEEQVRRALAFHKVQL